MRLQNKLSYKLDLLNWQVSSIWGFTGTVFNYTDPLWHLLLQWFNVKPTGELLLINLSSQWAELSFLHNVSEWKCALISISFRRFSGNSVKLCATDSNDVCTCPTAPYATVWYGQGQQRFLAWCHKICILKREKTQRGSKWPSKPFSLKTAFPMKKKKWMVNI